MQDYDEGFAAVAIDPGGTTGIAYYEHGACRQLTPAAAEIDVHFSATQITGDDHHGELYNALGDFCPDFIICERFDYRRNNKQKIDLSAREYIGTIKTYLQIERGTDVPLIMQSPMSHDNSFWNDEKLKRVGMLVEPASGNPHANDAIRHMLHWLTDAVQHDWKQPHKEYWLGRLK